MTTGGETGGETNGNWNRDECAEKKTGVREQRDESARKKIAKKNKPARDQA